VTLDLPRATAKRLHQLAIERETTIGQLAAPAIKAMLAGSCFVDRAGALVAIAEGTSELAGEAKAS
jgi:predicted transcriptional regulator